MNFPWILSENENVLQLNKEDLKDDTAYIQLTYVEPFKDGVNRSDFDLHTNIQKFFYEMSVIDELYPEAPEVARQGLKRIFVTG